jgi:hypothetical protein
MPPRKQRHDDAAFTVRTEEEHRDVFDLVADELGLSRSDFVSLLLAQVCGLDRPTGKPALVIDLAALPGRAAEALQATREGEVLRATA